MTQAEQIREFIEREIAAACRQGLSRDEAIKLVGSLPAREPGRVPHDRAWPPPAPQHRKKVDKRRKPRPPEPKPRATAYLDDVGVWHEIPKPKSPEQVYRDAGLERIRKEREALWAVQRVKHDTDRTWPSRSPWVDIDYTWGSRAFRELLGSQYTSDFRGAWQHSGQADYVLEQEHERLETEAVERLIGD